MLTSHKQKIYKGFRTIKNNRAIFKINENDYRLIVEINFQKSWVVIKFNRSKDSKTFFRQKSELPKAMKLMFLLC